MWGGQLEVCTNFLKSEVLLFVFNFQSTFPILCDAPVAVCTLGLLLCTMNSSLQLAGLLSFTVFHTIM